MDSQIEQFANENVLEEQLASKISNLKIPDFKNIANDPVEKPFSEYISEQVHVRLHSSSEFPKINHIAVHQQQGGNLCGFHCYWNAQCMIRAILGKY